MSGLGQKPTRAMQKGMSALTPKADMCGATRDVCFGPITDTRALLTGSDVFAFKRHLRIGDLLITHPTFC
jgi:hypothetical protein